MNTAYIYTQKDCEACIGVYEIIRESIEEQLNFIEIDIGTDPLAEIGIKLLTKGNELTVPIVVIPQKGIYLVSKNEPKQLVRLINLDVL